MSTGDAGLGLIGGDHCPGQVATSGGVRGASQLATCSGGGARYNRRHWWCTWRSEDASSEDAWWCSRNSRAKIWCAWHWNCRDSPGLPGLERWCRLCGLAGLLYLRNLRLIWWICCSWQPCSIAKFADDAQDSWQVWQVDLISHEHILDKLDGSAHKFCTAFFGTRLAADLLTRHQSSSWGASRWQALDTKGIRIDFW